MSVRDKPGDSPEDLNLSTSEGSRSPSPELCHLSLRASAVTTHVQQARQQLLTLLSTENAASHLSC